MSFNFGKCAFAGTLNGATQKHEPEVQKQGFEKIYLAAFGHSFCQADMTQIENYLHDKPIRGVALNTARAGCE